MFINIVKLQSAINSGPNAILLSRLKQLQIKTEKQPEAPVHKGEIATIKRTLTGERLLKLLNCHWRDPLIWNSDILGRIFDVPEEYCDNLIKYVQPMVYRIDNTSDKATKLVHTKLVIDVERLKNDKNYMKHLQNLVFPDIDIDKLAQEMKIINKGY